MERIARLFGLRLLAWLLPSASVLGDLATRSSSIHGPGGRALQAADTDLRVGAVIRLKLHGGYPTNSDRHGGAPAGWYLTACDYRNDPSRYAMVQSPGTFDEYNAWPTADWTVEAGTTNGTYRFKMTNGYPHGGVRGGGAPAGWYLTACDYRTDPSRYAHVESPGTFDEYNGWPTADWTVEAGTTNGTYRFKMANGYPHGGVRGGGAPAGWYLTAYDYRNGPSRYAHVEDPAAFDLYNSWASADWTIESSDGEYMQKCYELADMTGQWKFLSQIVGETEIQTSYGTVTGRTFTTAEEYAASLSVSLSQEGSVGVGIEGGPNFGASVTLETSVGLEWKNTFSQELSTEKSESTVWSVTVAAAMKGKVFWQFVLRTQTRCDEEVATETKQYALTGSREEVPCCLPGHCRDLHLNSCTWCAPGKKALYSEERCREGDPPCSEQVLQLEAINAFITVPELDEGLSATLACPAGYEGEVVVQCERTAVAVKGQNCVQNGCLCSAGTAAVGAACPATGATLCTRCSDGYVLNAVSKDCEKKRSLGPRR